MAILCDRNTKLLVQGMGRMGQFHAVLSVEYGTQVVGGVHPGKGGTRIEGIPIFDTVSAAVAATGADASVIFVPPPGAADAVLEAAAAGLRVTACITEGIPTLDMLRAKRALQGRPMRLVGPNCPGLVTPEQCRIGIMPAKITRPGPVGVVSRSGTLTYEAVDQLSRLGIGQSTCVGIGGDPVIGHAGAIIAGGQGRASDKLAALEAAGVFVAPSPAQIGETLAKNVAQLAG